MNGEPWLTVLTSEDIGILSISLESGLMKLQKIHPTENAMWHETCDLLSDLHASWEEKYA